MLLYRISSGMGLQRTVLNISLDVLRALVAMGNTKMLSEKGRN